jgi:hypothetical protein
VICIDFNLAAAGAPVQPEAHKQDTLSISRVGRLQLEGALDCNRRCNELASTHALSPRGLIEEGCQERFNTRGTNRLVEGGGTREIRGAQRAQECLVGRLTSLASPPPLLSAVRRRVCARVRMWI